MTSKSQIHADFEEATTLAQSWFRRAFALASQGNGKESRVAEAEGDKALKIAKQLLKEIKSRNK